MVANYVNGENGRTIEVGVIKNNQWLLEPTSDMPFVTKENMAKGKDPEVGDVTYLGRGCFVSEKETTDEYENIYVFYNVETGLSYSTANWSKKQRGLNFSMFESEQEEEVIAGYYSKMHLDNGCYYENVFVVLNKTDMTTYEIRINDSKKLSCQTNISDGLFSASEYVFEEVAGKLEFVEYNYYFYDLNGELVIDLSEYDIDYQRLLFFDGKCTFTMKKNFDGEYLVTINKSGKIINTVKK